MEMKSITVMVAIMLVILFAFYIAAGGITGLIISPGNPVQQSGENIAPIKQDITELSKPPEDLPKETPDKPKPDLCKNVLCPPNNTICPDWEVVPCENTCNPGTGQCSSCIPDCSGHQFTESGGGGGVPSPPTCTDTTWTLQDDWSECMGRSQGRTMISNCGNTRKETRDCVLVKINTTEDIYAIDFILLYDPSVAEYIEANPEGDFLKQDGSEVFTIVLDDNETGRIQFASTRFGTNEGVSGEGILANIAFCLTGTEPVFNLTNITLSDSHLQSVNISVSGGSIELA